LAQLIAAAAAGACLGAILGSLLFSVMAADTTATALVRINEPPDLVAVAGGADQTTPILPDNTERYVAGEVAYLSSNGFAQDVGARLGKAKPPKLKVVQEGRSSMVSISDTDNSRNDAIRAVQMTIDLYGQRLAARTDRQLQTILPALAQWEQAADGPDAIRNIRELRDRVRLQAEQSSRLPVLQPPMPDYVSSHRTLIGALLGGFLGGSLTPMILIARRRRSGLVSTAPGAPGLTGAVDEILVPVVDLRQPSRDAWGPEQAALGRTLYAQLGTPDPGRTIVLIGASATSGTSVVASLLEFAAAEHGPVRLTDAVGAARDAGTTLIVDAGPIGVSDRIPVAIASATDLVLVTRLGVDTAEQVHVVRAATADNDAALNAVFTSLPWWTFGWNSSHSSMRDADGPRR